MSEEETRLAVLEQRFQDHVELGNKIWETMEEKLDSIDDNVQDLRVSVARRNGALDENRRHASKMGAASGMLVSIIVAAIGALGMWLAS
jgi:hypothetical protein